MGGGKPRTLLSFMLTPRPTTPTQTLDLAFRRQKPTRAQLDDFQLAKQTLLAAINPDESEEHLKKPLMDFLAHPGVLGPDYYLNVRKKRDLVIRTGPKEAAPVGVLMEVKKAANKAEMVTLHDLNRKAFHELLLYYLQDRADQTADNLRRLVITNGYEWFMFDALDFDRLFWRNAALKNDFLAWAGGKRAGKTTDYFYQEIAYPCLAGLAGLAGLAAELPFAYLDLRTEPATERDRITLAKVFQAPHLLKAPFAQDANTLNRAFYEELLYLIGLEEVPEKGRKLIKQAAAEREQAGSLLRNTIDVLESEDRLANLPPAERLAYGPTPDAQLFGVALELCLTWVNRLLFLKLLEGQLRRYHAAGNPAALTEPFRFLTPALIPDFDTLNDLFFKVLNRPADQRTAAIQARYAHLPYLNSSLYEPSELERRTITVRDLRTTARLAYYPRTVVPHPGGAGSSRRRGSVLVVNSVHNKNTPAPPTADDPNSTPETLAYLLKFLDAYDFASEGDEQVQETHKPLISAAVLGLIFEKLNGYQDGSFYTPGFITMYMARHTLRRAVVQHFNRRSGYGAADVAALAEALPPHSRVADSAFFNTLTVLDPAVGSGHFLVSALNELLAIKAELGLLLDENGKRLRYRLTVARDELVVMHEDDDPHDPNALFQYRARLDPATGRRSVAPAHTALQRALFHDKRHLIEHALFGVDLNPNSVRICRLRLWIELLKHAYYLPETGFAQLETLPNLDLNIKTGNSLLSRFDLGADLSDVFRQSKFTLATYRDAVHAYFNTRDRAAKQELQKFLGQIKEQFTATIYRGDPLRREILTLKSELLRVELDAKPDMFGKAKITEEEAWERTTTLNMRLRKAEDKLAEREKGQLYRHAFEWRFEFPEVLDEKGQFRGFDVVIGNPPYGIISKAMKPIMSGKFIAVNGNYDLYTAFIELAFNLCRPEGDCSYITPVSWLTGEKFKHLRLLLQKQSQLKTAIVLPYNVFSEAYVDTGIFEFKKSSSEQGYESDVYRFDPKSETGSSLFDGLKLSQLSSSSWQKTDSLSIVFNASVTTKGSMMFLNSVPLSTLSDSARGIRANAEDISATYVEGYSPLFIGDLKRYTIQESFSYVKYGNNLPEHPSSEEIFNGERILVRRLISRQFRVMAMLPNDDFINKKDLYVIKLTNKLYSTKYVLAIINSALVSELITGGSTSAVKNDFSQVTLRELRELPIPHATPEQQAKIAALVEQVLAAKAAGAPTAPLEAAIDALVAARYGLTPAEVAQLG